MKNIFKSMIAMLSVVSLLSLTSCDDNDEPKFESIDDYTITEVAILEKVPVYKLSNTYSASANDNIYLDSFNHSNWDFLSNPVFFKSDCRFTKGQLNEFSRQYDYSHIRKMTYINAEAQNSTATRKERKSHP